MAIQQRLGQLAEEQACRYLLAQGLQLVARNYRCYRGEIDLIVQDKITLVFVEVRYRTPSRFGNAVDTITAHKQRKLIKAALHYLQSNPTPTTCRFDVISVMPRPDKTLDFIWIRDAFQVEY